MSSKLRGEGSEAFDREEFNVPTHRLRSIGRQLGKPPPARSSYYPHSLDNLQKPLDLGLWWTHQASSIFAERMPKEKSVRWQEKLD